MPIENFKLVLLIQGVVFLDPRLPTKQDISGYINTDEKLTADALIDLSLKLSNVIKVQGVDFSHNENDMLLFQ